VFAAPLQLGGVGVLAAGVNGPGSAASQLDGPTDLFVDRRNNLYVLDRGNNRIQKFAPGDTAATTVGVVANGAAYTMGRLNKLIRNIDYIRSYETRRSYHPTFTHPDNLVCHSTRRGTDPVYGFYAGLAEELH
jgi:hypothetical protein